MSREPGKGPVGAIERDAARPGGNARQPAAVGECMLRGAGKVAALGSAISPGDGHDLVGEIHDRKDICNFTSSSSGRFILGREPGQDCKITGMSTPLQNRVKERLAALGTTAYARSLEFTGGTDKNLFANILAGKSKNPRSDTMQIIADALETTVEWLLHGDGEPTPPRIQGTPQGNARAAAVEMPPRSSLLKDIEVRGTIAGSMAGAFQYEGGAVDYVGRPPGLFNARGVYALYVEGTSMVPAHQPGDLRFISPFKHPGIGDDVAITAKYHADGPIECFIKTLVRRTESKIIVKQINPEAIIEFSKEYIVSIHKVLTTNELFGI